MKTCKYGCGGKMKEGGKVATMKKMKVGGTSSKPCGPGLCRDGQGSCINCASAKLAGVITTGISSAFANAIASKKRKENTAKKKISTSKTEAAQETAQEKRKGGAVKKHAMGGNTGGYAKPQMGGDNTKMGIYGIPNAGRTDSLGFKKGGITKAKFGTSVNVQRGYPGKIRSSEAQGYTAVGKREPARTKFAKGGFPDLNKDGKVTKADILKGRGVIKRVGGTVKKK